MVGFAHCFSWLILVSVLAGCVCGVAGLCLFVVCCYCVLWFDAAVLGVELVDCCVWVL